MTLVLTVHSRDCFWVLVDRRLSYGRQRPPRDDAIKAVAMETTDGVGVLAYAGLGATSSGTQPSDWMRSVLRGRGGLPFEQTLSLLSEVANRELPRHLLGLPGGGHFITIPAFVQGFGPRLYTIDNVVDPTTRQHRYRFTSQQRVAEPGSPSVRIALIGTGGVFLGAQNHGWQRALFSLVKAHDRGRVSPLFVADYLASLNNRAHLGVRDATVGPRSIVIWRYRPKGRQVGSGGGGHQFYTVETRDEVVGPLPSISNGIDVQPILEVIMAEYQRVHADPTLGFPAAVHLDHEGMQRRLGELPTDPNDGLA